MAKEIYHNGYNITIENIPHNGMYKLSTWAFSMGEEYQETMLSDNLDEETLDKFIRQVENNK